MICEKHGAPYDDAHPCLRCEWEKIATEPPTRPELQASRKPVVEVDRPGLARISLAELIPALSPQFAPPTHLVDWCGMIQRALTEAIRGLCSVPIRHYKTETTVHGIIWLLLQDPSLRIMFLTHSFEAAAKWGKRIRQLAEAADMRASVDKGTFGPARGWNTIAEWRNDSGGGVVVMSADQSKIGYDCHVLIVDDSISEKDADDPVKRDEVDAAITFYTARCMRNGKPGAVLIVASRFHPDDPTGRRLARTAVLWEYIHHAAIEDEGLPSEHAFAPSVLGLGALKRIREELKESDPAERVWWSQFQNNPQPESSDLFGAPTHYAELPSWNGWRVVHMVDFAYSDAPGADFFAIGTGRAYGRKLYLLEFQRHKLDATLLESTCKATTNKYGPAPFWSYQSGPEIGLSKLLIQRGVRVAPMPARYNKLVRAQKTIRRWNEGDILVPAPSSALWVPGFLHRVSLFRGHERDKDDEVDALVSGADAALGGATTAAGSAHGGRKPYTGMLG